MVYDKFSLINLDDIFGKQGTAKYFLTVDVTSSFHRIELKQKSRPCTAFSIMKAQDMLTLALTAFF